jgi:hypothetical protein
MKFWVNLCVLILLITSPLGASATHDREFWRSIRAHDFAVPPGESVDQLTLEIVDLAAEPDPVLRDECGYEILAAWVYQKNLVSGETLEAVRRKLISGMTIHIGESDNPTIFRRSFSALYMSVLAAQDLHKAFLSQAAFRETLDTALKCYSDEKDFRGYIPNSGWAHATAHVADLLKFLARNPQLSTADQRQIVNGIARRCQTVPSVFAWGEDARMAAALLSIIERKDFDSTAFDPWFKEVVAENKELWKTPVLNTAAYIHVRNGANVLTQLAARIASKKPTEIPATFTSALNATVADLN